MDYVYSTEARIEAIFEAADAFWNGKTNERERDRKLSDAIDAAMSHAYAEGRADERREWLDKEMREATKAAMSTVEAIERIWNLPPREAA